MRPGSECRSTMLFALRAMYASPLLPQQSRKFSRNDLPHMNLGSRRSIPEMSPEMLSKKFPESSRVVVEEAREASRRRSPGSIRCATSGVCLAFTATTVLRSISGRISGIDHLDPGTRGEAENSGGTRALCH